MMVSNILGDHCNNCDDMVKWAYWSCLIFLLYWLWHDLLDILDFMAPEDQDWIDEITLEDEKEKILEIIVQPNQFCQTCWYWLDLIVNGVDEVDR